MGTMDENFYSFSFESGGHFFIQKIQTEYALSQYERAKNEQLELEEEGDNSFQGITATGLIKSDILQLNTPLC